MSLVELLLSNEEPHHKLRHVGKPLGATFLGICMSSKLPSKMLATMY